GAVWLDPARTSPYAFYQYWINVADADVGICLRYLTELPEQDILALEAAQREQPGDRPGQRALARWLTGFVHGEAGLAAAERATAMLFGAEITALTDAELGDIFADVPSASITQAEWVAGVTVVDALVRTGLAASKGEARRALQSGAVALNNRRIDRDRPLSDADRASESVVVLRSGKKRYALLRIESANR
ncbi:MAG: S4 domain-containing protein, partial [Casimicrobiaceae bacterium]